jgi:hypothetical protein
MHYGHSTAPAAASTAAAAAGRRVASTDKADECTNDLLYRPPVTLLAALILGE